MTTTTGTRRPNGSRDGSFDALISSERAGTAAREAGFNRTDEIEELLLAEQQPAKAPLAAVVMIVIVTLVLIVSAVTAVVASRPQPADAAPVDVAPVEEPAGVTASSITAQVEQGWADAGESGSVTCPEPTSQSPGTSIDCTAVYEEIPLVFTAVIGDTAAGEPQILIASWSEAG